MNDPKFLVIGAARAGTTAMHFYLQQHPQLFLPKQKEPCFFCFTGAKLNYQKGKFAFAVTEEEEYKKLFSHAKPGQLTGEISTPYLYLYHSSIANIKKYIEQSASLKIIIILRNPVDRAYSQYLWRIRDGREVLTFEEALKQEKMRMEENYSFDYFYAHRGLYYEQVKSYLDNFSFVKIIQYDDFKNEFERTMADLCNFLGVDSAFEFTRKDFVNSSYQPKFKTLGKLVTVESKMKFKFLNYLPGEIRTSIRNQFHKWNASAQPPEPISDEAKRYLLNYYREDIRKLQQLLDTNLEHWMD